MATCERNSHGQNTLNPHRAGGTVIAFQPFGTTGWHGERSPSGTATVLPFLLPRSSPQAQSVLTGSQSAAKSAKRADQSLGTREEEYRQRMFENVLAAAWVGTLLSAGSYMLNVLAAPSTFH
jgi:hypothetical protein